MRLLADSIFHDPETGILFASFKYVGYNWAGDSKNLFLLDPSVALFFIDGRIHFRSPIFGKSPKVDEVGTDIGGL